MRRVIISLLSLSLASAADFESVDLFHEGEGGVHTYRIPALVQTLKGTLIAVADARHDSTSDLPAHLSLVIRRSMDGGRHWTAARMLREVKEGGVGDPSLLLDRSNGRVWCMHAYGPPGVGFGNSKPGANTLQVNAIYSDDDGATWSSPRDLTPQVKDPAWNGLFATSGTNIQTSTGRLLVPLAVNDSNGTIGSRNAYSDDHGKTWKTGGWAGTGSDESHAVELADGTILQNIRTSAKDHEHTRGVARSADGGVTFGPMEHDAALVDPACNAGIARRKDVLIFTNVADAAKRRMLTVRLSYDGGKTWRVSRVLQAGPAAYSTVIFLQDGDIGMLYEQGEKSSIEKITFARFPLEWVTGGHHP
jgi:sialidase-1